MPIRISEGPFPEENGDANPQVVSVPTYQRSIFGEQRVVLPYTQADIISTYGRDTRIWDASTANGGAVTDVITQSAISLAVTGANGSSARIRTHTYFRYQAGKGHVSKYTVIHADTGKVDQVRRWGLFDDLNGVFFELRGTALRLVRRSDAGGAGVVDTVIAQAAWLDPLDGTGPSRFTLDITKGNIYEIRFQWLGVGDVEWWVSGHLAHREENANSLSTVTFRTATLPGAAEVVNAAESIASSLKFICLTVQSDGGSEPPEFTWGVKNAAAITVAGGATRPILSIRPRATFKTLTNRVILIPRWVTLSSETNRASLALVVNGTLTGPAFAAVNAESAAEFDVAATAITGGEEVFYAFIPTSAVGTFTLERIFGAGVGSEYLNRILRQSGFATSLDTLTLVATNEQGGNTDFIGSFTWSETNR